MVYADIDNLHLIVVRCFHGSLQLIAMPISSLMVDGNVGRQSRRKSAVNLVTNPADNWMENCRDKCCENSEKLA